MKNTIISIYPAKNGRLNIDVTRDSRKIHFVSRSKNIFVITMQIQTRLFFSWIGEKFSLEFKPAE